MHRDIVSYSRAPLLSKQDLARILGVSCRQIDYMRKNQSLPWFQVGSQIRFSEEKVYEWLATKEQNGVQK